MSSSTCSREKCSSSFAPIPGKIWKHGLKSKACTSIFWCALNGKCAATDFKLPSNTRQDAYLQFEPPPCGDIFLSNSTRTTSCNTGILPQLRMTGFATPCPTSGQSYFRPSTSINQLVLYFL